MTFLRAQFYPFSLLILCLAVLAVWGLRDVGFRTDDLQTLLFPLVLFSVWRLPKDHRFSVPVPVVLAALSIWLLSAMNVRGFMPNLLMRDGVYLSRLSDDVDGTGGRQFLWHYNSVADDRGSPPSRVIERTFSTDIAAKRWLDSHASALLVLRGSSQWLQIVFPPGRRIFGESRAQLTPDVTELLASYDIRSGDEVIAIESAGIPVPLFVVSAPEFVSLPGEPVGIARDVLGFLAQGVELRNTDDSSFYDRLEHFYQAVAVEGAWKTNEPRAVASFFAGTERLIQFATSSPSDRAQVNCALSDLARARERVQPQFAPHVAAAIENNIAVAFALKARNREDFRDVRGKLLDVIRRSDGGASHARGVRVALANLILLDRAGII